MQVLLLLANGCSWLRMWELINKAMFGFYSRPSPYVAWGLSLGMAVVLFPTGCSSLSIPSGQESGLGKLTGLIQGERAKSNRGKASHRRNWRPDLMVLPHAEFEADRVRLFNIRDCEYRSEEDYDVRHFDRQVVFSDVQSIDFIVVPFKETPAIAHTMLSFGLADGEHIVFSVEARLEQGEVYSALPSATKQYELMWVVGTERDLIRLRTEVRDVDVYLYRLNVSPAQAQRAFMAAVARVNEIARQPEFYDLLTNNCTTNIVDMVNSLRPGYIPQDIRVVLPGHSDRLAYDLGLLAAKGPFEEIKAAARVNLKAKLHSDSKNFSAMIRQAF